MAVSEDSEAHAVVKIATLARLKGIGANDATLLTHEIFYRGFRNRRGLASWVGMTPTPWASGVMERDQGIGRDGPAWIRAQLIQMAWWTLLTKVETSCDRILIAGGANVEAEWEQGPAV